MFEGINKDTIEKGILSNPLDDSKYKKVTIKKISIKNEMFYQIEAFTKTQAFHENKKPDEIFESLEEYMKYFRQAEIWTSLFYYGFKVSQKGKILTTKKACKTSINIVAHNKEKEYILKEGTVVPALVDLGVMSQDGKIFKSHYDKYKQINKFLEIIDSTIGYEEELNIIDFGCGKSYLTFILYYYLVNIKNIKANIIGLDLKEDVIKKCNEIAYKYGYTGLKFEMGDISLYKPKNKVDMIITLHACDTATDAALYHAIKLKCKYILSVPCCQHQINNELTKDVFPLMNKYGLIKERFSSLLTDSIRANILEYYGYKVNVMEFIDFIHSPKNILIKGVLTSNKPNEELKKSIDDMLNEYHISQALYDMCFKQ
ncbi:MAG: class I SAM-dependent methyltransferase [Anaeroplasmataceae bacterium]